MKEATQVGTPLSTFGDAIMGAFAGALGMAVGLFLGASGGKAGTEFAKNRTVDNSGAMKLARRICDEWLLDSKTLSHGQFRMSSPFWSDCKITLQLGEKRKQESALCSMSCVLICTAGLRCEPL